MKEFMHNLQEVGFLTDVRESSLVYPVIMTIHLICIAVFGGMILVTNMRLLGLMFTKYSVTDVVGGLRNYKRAGLVIMLTAGFLLGASEGDKYYPNPFFWIKITLLLLLLGHSLAFGGSVYRNTEEMDRTGVIPGKAKLAATLSLVLWLSVLVFGRLIGYWEGDEQKPKAEQARVEQSQFQR